MTARALLLACSCVFLAAAAAGEEQPAESQPRPDAFTEALKRHATSEARVILVSREHSRLRYYERGALLGDYEVAFGQADGAKEVRGDLKTPRGSYYVLHKSKGPFTGDFGDFYGGHSIKVNYPSSADAERGLDAGTVTRTQAEAISLAWAARKPTDERTKLGGGIGFHGWSGAWAAQDGGTFLSFGCVVLHNADIEQLYPLIRPGTLVVIF